MVFINLDGWINGCKVTACPWIDGKTIYFNVQYYIPGSSVEKPPAWDKTVYVTDNAVGRRLVFEFTHSLTEFVSRMEIAKNTKVVLTA